MHLKSSGKIFCARILLALAFAFSPATSPPSGLTGFTRWSDNGFALAGTTAVAIWHTDLLARPPDEMKIAETILAGDQITFRFSKLSPGLYVFIQAPALGGEWTAVGDSFRETTTEISVPTSDAQKFYQLIKF